MLVIFTYYYSDTMSKTLLGEAKHNGISGCTVNRDGFSQELMLNPEYGRREEDPVNREHGQSEFYCFLSYFMGGQPPQNPRWIWKNGKRGFDFSGFRALGGLRGLIC